MAVDVFRYDRFLIEDISDLILFIKLGQYFHPHKISVSPAKFNGFEIFRRDHLVDDIGAAADQLVDERLMVIIIMLVVIAQFKGNLVSDHFFDHFIVPVGGGLAGKGHGNVFPFYGQGFGCHCFNSETFFFPLLLHTVIGLGPVICIYFPSVDVNISSAGYRRYLHSKTTFYIGKHVQCTEHIVFKSAGPIIVGHECAAELGQRFQLLREHQ